MPNDRQRDSKPDRTALIFGNGGHAHVIASYLPHRRIRFVVERDPGPDDLLQSEFFGAAPDLEADYFIGIGDNVIRRAYFDRLVSMGLRLPACVGPNAWIAGNARLGQGAFIGAFGLVGARAVVGDNVIINTGTAADHDTVVEDDVQLAAHVIVAGGAIVRRAAFVGLKVAILPMVEIGAEAFVMAGAVVTRSVPPGARVAGVPAVLKPVARPVS